VAEIIKVYAVPREFNLSYGLLLPRRWIREVKSRGNYELDKYYIQEPNSSYREIRRANTPRVSSVEVPQVKLNEPGGETDDSRMDKETKDELELAEASSGGGDEGIFHEVRGQASRAVREQLLRSDADD
jgi:hypothetical protein